MWRNGQEHPRRKEIEDAILRKEKWVWIQATFNCSSSTICRYRKYLFLDKNNKEQIKN